MPDRKHIEVRYALKRVAEGRWKHGTPYCYGRLGCRLPECLKAMRDHQKKYEKSNA